MNDSAFRPRAAEASPPLDRLMRIREVQAATSMGRTTIYKLIREGDFPAPTQLTPGAVAWFEDEVRGWLALRRSRRSGPRE